MSRRYNAEYYDAAETHTNDVEFYRRFVGPSTRVLELGCGSGRVTLPLASSARTVVGVDISAEMLAAAKAKNKLDNVTLLRGDICALQLPAKYDLIIAPFRVMQALELDYQVEGLFRVIQEHLAEGGTAILNVFRPLYSKEEMPRVWPRPGESPEGEVTLPDGDLLKVFETRERVDPDRQVLYPVLIYRRYRDGNLIDEHVNPICMRYYYPEELKQLISSKGFLIKDCWGGYDGEAYGRGPELVVAFDRP